MVIIIIGNVVFNMPWVIFVALVWFISEINFNKSNWISYNESILIKFNWIESNLDETNLIQFYFI